ncbi:MAG TPA: sugar phosphate isomerase/epimerase [Thermomicrobiales bacterium]|nr:sugar phosphate isomerase/epimerase [Thermomicrobiales bacterium]
MLNVRIGHTALTWNVLEEPDRLTEAIRDCAELGFAGTETGGFVYDWWEQERPGELRRQLQDHGVVMACLFEFGDWIDPAATGGLVESGRRWATGVQELGGQVLMLVPGGRRDDPPYNLDEFKRMAETMNRVGREAREAGAIAAMHPHWGTMAESPLEIDVLVDRLDPADVGFAPDTGQIAKGGADPIAAVERWADRVRHVHLKDLSPQWADQRRAGVPLRSPEGYVELGQGVIDLRPLLPILDRVNYAGWLMAELDEAKRPAREAAELSLDYLSGTLGLKFGPSA